MKHSDKRPEKHLLRNAQRTIADCKDHCGTKTKVYKIIKKSSTANKKSPVERGFKTSVKYFIRL